MVFQIQLYEFLRRWLECQKNLGKWSKKDKEDFLRDIKPKEETNKEKKQND